MLLAFKVPPQDFKAVFQKGVFLLGLSRLQTGVHIGVFTSRGERIRAKVHLVKTGSYILSKMNECLSARGLENKHLSGAPNEDVVQNHLT